VILGLATMKKHDYVRKELILRIENLASFHEKGFGEFKVISCFVEQ
jgi:hypothetical protein